MITDLLEHLPAQARNMLVGALLLACAASSVYAVAAFAADKRVRAIETTYETHANAQRTKEEYDRALQEAIWITLLNLCEAEGVRCEKMPIPR